MVMMTNIRLFPALLHIRFAAHQYHHCTSFYILLSTIRCLELFILLCLLYSYKDWVQWVLTVILMVTGGTACVFQCVRSTVWNPDFWLWLSLLIDVNDNIEKVREESLLVEEYTTIKRWRLTRRDIGIDIDAIYQPNIHIRCVASVNTMAIRT